MKRKYHLFLLGITVMTVLAACNGASKEAVDGNIMSGGLFLKYNRGGCRPVLSILEIRQ